MLALLLIIGFSSIITARPEISDTISHTSLDVEDEIHIIQDIKAIKDSISVVALHVGKTSSNTQAYPWTYINIVLAFLGAVFAGFGCRYSWKTAKNIERVNRTTQEKLFEDLIRHLYRNNVCTLAFAAKMEKNPVQYPSDEHILKLKTLPEDIHVEQYNSKSEDYAIMHGLCLLLRNYNTEIEIIHEHLRNPHLDIIVKKEGLRTMLFKPLYLTNRILEAMNKVYGKDNRMNVITIILSEHYNKLSENYNKKDVWQYQSMSNVIERHIEYDQIKNLTKGINTIKPEIIFDDKNKILKDDFKDIYKKMPFKFTKEESARMNELKDSDDLLRVESLTEEKNNFQLDKDEFNELENLKKSAEVQELDRLNKLNSIKSLEEIMIKEANLKEVPFNEEECNTFDLISNALITDGIIEYGKIRMIDYPES